MKSDSIVFPEKQNSADLKKLNFSFALGYVFRAEGNLSRLPLCLAATQTNKQRGLFSFYSLLCFQVACLVFKKTNSDVAFADVVDVADASDVSVVVPDAEGA